MWILTEDTGDLSWQHLVIIAVAATIISTIGWIQVWAKNQWGKKFGPIIDMAADAAEAWAQHQFATGFGKPMGDEKLAWAVRHAQELMQKAPKHLKGIDTVIKALEGTLVLKKNAEKAKDVVHSVTTIINKWKT